MKKFPRKQLCLLSLRILWRLTKRIWPAFLLLAFALILPSRYGAETPAVIAFSFITILVLLIALTTSYSVLTSEIPTIKIDGSSMVSMEYRDATLQINLMRISLPKALKNFSTITLDNRFYIAIGEDDYGCIANRLQSEPLD